MMLISCCRTFDWLFVDKLVEDDGGQWDWLQVRLGVAPDSQGCFHPGPQVGTVGGLKGGHQRAGAAGGQTRSGSRPGQRGQRATGTGKVV